jgi:sugar phosphate isomerase/epimerase
MGKRRRGRGIEVCVSLSRRDVLWQLSLVALAPRFALGGVSAEPSLSFPRQPRDRLAVTSWPFRSYINSPGNKAFDRGKMGFDLKEFPSVVVQRFGVHNINPLAAHFSSTDHAYLVAFREAVEKAGSHVVDLGLSSGKFYDADASKRQAGVDYGRQWIDIAVLIGSPSVRQHVAGAPGDKPDVALAAESLGQVAEYGAKRNIVVNLENDGPVSEDPFFLTAIIEKVNSPYLRALPDFGNSLLGHDAEFNRRAVAAMLSHAFNMCHVKDTVKDAEGQVHEVDLKTMFQLAKQAGYPGYFSMEFDTASGDPFPCTEHLIAETLLYLN